MSHGHLAVRSKSDDTSSNLVLCQSQGLSWTGGPGRAGPDRSENCDGPGRAGPSILKMCWAGPWVYYTATTTTTSILPMRRPTCFDRPARAAAQEMWCTTVLLYTWYLVLLQYYYDDVHVAHEAAHGLSPPETRAGPCKTCTNKSRKTVYCCDDVFFRSDIPSAYQYKVKIGTTTWY